MSCSSCKPKRNTAESIKKAEHERKRKGCTEPSNIPQYQDDETGQVFYRCPISQVKPWTWGILNLYNCFKAGFLPLQKGVLEQPARIMNLFKSISRYEYEYLKRKKKD